MATDPDAATFKFPNGGGFFSSAGTKAAGVANMCIIVDLSGIVWGPAPFAEKAHMSLRDDLSYTPQFYTRIGFGGMRIDDNKVICLFYK